jgi:sortase A
MAMDETLRPAAVARTRSWPAALRRVVRVVGWTSITLGLLILGFVVQQLVVTTWFSQQNQVALASDLEARFSSAEIGEAEYTPPVVAMETPEGGATVEGLDPLSPAPTVRSLVVESAPLPSDAVAVIRVPTIERLENGWVVVEGVRTGDLKNGAGHMPDTPLPGQPGNTVISGHRTTYGAPFHEFDTLEPGDAIELESAIGTNIYEVRESLIVNPRDLWVTSPRPGSWLTLTTCNPKFSSRQRLVVFAELVAGPNYESIYG